VDHGLFLCISSSFNTITCGFEALGVVYTVVMTKELRPLVFRKHGRALAFTVPAAYVHEMGLVPGDQALVKREPDGLRLRIIRHSTLVELANASEEGSVTAAE
jgi:antitoxin component of MazEF toxin-antitoxin module